VRGEKGIVDRSREDEAILRGKPPEKRRRKKFAQATAASDPTRKGKPNEKGKQKSGEDSRPPQAEDLACQNRVNQREGKNWEKTSRKKTTTRDKSQKNRSRKGLKTSNSRAIKGQGKPGPVALLRPYHKKTYIN